MTDLCLFFFFKLKTAYELRISDGSSDVCSSDLTARFPLFGEPVASESRYDSPADESDHPHDERDTCTRSKTGFRYARGCEVVPRACYPEQIGSASCRERVCQYVSIAGVA